MKRGVAGPHGSVNVASLGLGKHVQLEQDGRTSAFPESSAISVPIQSGEKVMGCRPRGVSISHAGLGQRRADRLQLLVEGGNLLLIEQVLRPQVVNDSSSCFRPFAAFSRMIATILSAAFCPGGGVKRSASISSSRQRGSSRSASANA